MVVCADGSSLAAEKLDLVLPEDSGTGVLRHADAGDPAAVAFAKREGIRIPRS